MALRDGQIREQAIQHAVEQAVRAQAGDQSFTPKRRLDEAQARSAETDNELKKLYGTRIFWLLLGQVAVTNVFMFIYAGCGLDWNVPPNVIIAWLSGTVVELIGVTAIVVKYLFWRPRDSN